MKKFLFLAIVSMATSKVISAQGTYVVNNVPGSVADYHVLQHALDSVPSGSIILLQNSGLNYGSAYVRKPIVIYGAGYFLGENLAPNTQAILQESIINYLEFDSASQGSIISGLHIRDSANDQNIINQRLSISNTSNITVSRCLIDPAKSFSNNYGGNAIGVDNSSNITIKQCFINTSGTNEALVSLTSSAGILFTNNLIIGSVNFTGFNNSNSTYTLTNNTFYGNIPEAFNASGCQTLENNIIIVSDTSANNSPFNGFLGTYFPFSNADHNITNVQNLFQYDALADGTNLINVNLTIDSVFLHYSNPLISSVDGNYELKPNTVAKNFGKDGTDAGAYGGSYFYVLSGIPAIPNIYFAQVPQTGTSVGGLKVHLKIHANN